MDMGYFDDMDGLDPIIIVDIDHRKSSHKALPLLRARFARTALSRAEPSNSVPKSLSMKTPTPKL